MVLESFTVRCKPALACGSVLPQAAARAHRIRAQAGRCAFEIAA